MLPDTAKPIAGTKLYFIDPLGNVYNPSGRKLSNSTCNGYVSIKLRFTPALKRRGYMIHRLIYETFVGPIPKGYWINHKDGVRGNNNIDNLEAVTPSANHLHASRVLKRRYLRGDEVRQGKLPEVAVELIRKLYKEGSYSQYKLAEIFQVSQCAISNIVNNLSFNHMQEL